jgi:hypothetical protein
LRWGREDAPLRGARVAVLIVAEFGQNPGLQERLHQPQHTLVLHPGSDAVHQGHVIDPVEARLDIGVQHPAIAVGAELVNLSDRIVCAPLRPEPVGDRLKVGLEDRFQHQLQRSLDYPVSDGGDA